MRRCAYDDAIGKPVLAVMTFRGEVTIGVLPARAPPRAAARAFDRFELV